jgi:hypothetical protein
MDDSTAGSGGGQSSSGPVDTSPAPPAGAAAAESVSGSGAGGEQKTKGPVTRGPLFAVVALVLLLASIFAGRLIFKRDKPIDRPPSSSSSPTARAPATKSFRDATEGIAFDYPADWSQLESAATGPTTKAFLGTGRGELLKLDVYMLTDPPAPEAIPTRQMTDTLDKTMTDNADATITTRELRNVNGVNTWHYIAQFRDAELGEGVWDVWFFFSGAKLEKLLFQAFPLSDYDGKYKTEFENVVRSYHTVPRGKGGATPAPSGSPST